MAKKITILENAVEKSVSKVAKIKTKLANGRDCYWVPEEDYPLGVLNVTEDGVYNASSDLNGPFYGYSEVNVEGVGNVEMGTLGTITITANGTYEATTDSQGPFYGYSTVIVNVSDEDAAPDHISGKDPDGNDEVVTVDDDGHLVEETVPSSIKIISPPDIITYYDGELIDFHGIYVKGYLEDGTEWGVVPNNELSFSEPIAEYDGSTADKYGTATLDESTVYYSKDVSWEYKMTVRDYVNARHATTSNSYLVVSGTSLYAISLTSDIAAELTCDPPDPGRSEYFFDLCAPTYSYNGVTKTFYSMRSVQTYYSSGPKIEYWTGTLPLDSRQLETIAKILFEGAMSPPYSTQTIPVQWHRPGDGKSLYDNFEITVNKPDDSGGQDPQPAPTPSPD